MAENWRTYTLRDDLEKPEGERRTVEIKSLTCGDSLLLGMYDAAIIEHVHGFCPDEQTKVMMGKLKPQTLTTFARLTLGTRNFQGFPGGKKNQGPIEATLNAKAVVGGMWPEWTDEILYEISQDEEVTEDEAKN